ncbi:MAG: carbamoyltransferase C-terminal domain-containing protein [Candidatus Micrarchaeia archaeon]
MAILGINDSHDAGAALVEDTSIVGAVNEERFTKRKNDVGFPSNSIRYLDKGRSDEIDAIALGWIGGNALVSRIFPQHDIKRRMLWRHELGKPSRLHMHLSNLVYRASQNQNPKFLWRAIGNAISSDITRKRLGIIKGELAKKKVYVVEHHLAHAASAYYPSGFKKALIITLDGAGDGLSGSVSVGRKGEIKRLASFKASTSLGLMYGAATVACDMRYSEDEGKLMSLAAYSYPKEIKELNEICRYDTKRREFVSKHGTRNELLLAEYMKDHILSKNDRESFAYAVQRHAEEQVRKLVMQWVDETGIRDIAVAGGFFSNVITNSMIEHMPEVRHLFVFPQMGDGGLSAGAAMYVDFMLGGKLSYKQIESAYFGPSYSDEHVYEALKRNKNRNVHYERVGDPEGTAADLINEGKIVLWFQGGMEYGPRALGNRSVLALPGIYENREKLNLLIKKRPYYQPFASTILEEDAEKLLSDYVSPNRFMTSANRVKDEYYKDMVAASHIDRTTRPQILGNENKQYRELIKKVKRSTGIGAVLNTSLNKHGVPIAMSPEDAIWTLENTGADRLVIGNYLVEKK